MHNYKKILCVCLSALLILPFSSCGSSKTDQLLKYNIASDPVNLDPPLADDPQSALVVTNLFEGLLRLTADGKLTEGVATDYDVSGDGLTYTFHLRSDAKWSDGTPLTAKDFVFGFQRLFNPSTGSQSAKKLYCIQNAEQVHTGLLPVSSLGVTADDDYTLTIKLAYQNAMFLTLLTTPAAMPCNEAFFIESKGRYGLTEKTLLSNGAYRLKEWSKGKYLALRRNEEYHSATKVKNGGVSLYIQPDAAVTLEDFKNGSVHAFFLEGVQAEQLTGKGFNIDRNSNSVWGILLNRTKPALANGNITNALMYGLDRLSYEESLTDYLTPANAIVPPAVSILEKPYREELALNVTAPAYNAEQAIQFARAGFSDLQVTSLTELTVIVPKDTPLPTLFSYISQVWQRDLKIYFKVEQLEPDEYLQRLDTGDFDCAVLQLTGDYNSPDTFLSQFNEMGKYGIQVPGLEDLLMQASRGSTAESAALYGQAEQLILNTGVFLPVAYQTNCFVSSSSVTGFIHDISGQIVDFKNCVFQ